MAMGSRPWAAILADADERRREFILRRAVRLPQTAQLPNSLSAVGRQFIRGCMQTRRASRPHALQLLDAPFLASPGASTTRKRGRVEGALGENGATGDSKRYRDEYADL
jgi:hypothetical protein